MASDDTHEPKPAVNETEKDVTTGSAEQDMPAKRGTNWFGMMGNRSKKRRSGLPSSRNSMSDLESQAQKKPDKWCMGILNDPETEEVPGSILLMSKVSEYNEPLGMRHAPARTSASSIPSPYQHPSSRRGSQATARRPSLPEKKLTADGKIVLEPQPDESPNDPLNWKAWRRDTALFSLGLYCMVGGGMTPVLAAGFNDVAEEYDISVPRVALTTGLYMMGLGVGCVLLSPTAILYGKRPVYLASAICFILSSIWSALAPNFTNLVIARIIMGIAVSSVECLPSATVAEIFFLHEKAYRLGIYTLLLLGGKNLVPLVSAVVIQSLHWRWVFWIVAIIVAFCGVLLFLFVPETFWDRTPRAAKYTRGSHKLSSYLNLARRGSIVNRSLSPSATRRRRSVVDGETAAGNNSQPTIAERRAERHAHFQLDESEAVKSADNQHDDLSIDQAGIPDSTAEQGKSSASVALSDHDLAVKSNAGSATIPHSDPNTVQLTPAAPVGSQTETIDYFNLASRPGTARTPGTPSSMPPGLHTTATSDTESDHAHPNPYVQRYASAPPKSFVQALKPYAGRLTKDSWVRVMFRPFILFAYPSILLSTLVYSLSVGWLIVLSESVAHIYQDSRSYNFTALQTGLVYISPFIGGVLGTAVAGKLSDVVVRYMSRRNGGVYEPEFRLVMAIPVLLTTTIGLMGFGWSAEERNNWAVPTVFFGFISFGCSLGSTTAITFAVDSYRQYAGEALVTLNFSKNIFHGLVFSLFFPAWLEHDGSKDVFNAIGGIQIACLLTTIPMYIFGKKARMWTVRKNFMEKF